MYDKFPVFKIHYDILNLVPVVLDSQHPLYMPTYFQVLNSIMETNATNATICVINEHFEAKADQSLKIEGTFYLDGKLEKEVTILLEVSQKYSFELDIS